MALAEAILVCLTERPMSGYDLAKNFDASIGYFWRASHQQIYRELGRLREKGLVNSEEVNQEGKPNRIIHTLTQEGKIYLRTWSKRPASQPSIKDDLMVKFYALENMDISALKEQLLIRVDKHKDLLNRYYRIKEKYYDGKSLDLTQKGKLIVLEMGIHTEVNNIERIEDSVRKIEQL
ncbi:PadR family transcriptional regulator [Hellea sp.]|jgi:DNA-binding PadR family transcriptional regulator|nr:PadR family transcriptional regulator [Hellea sp.]